MMLFGHFHELLKFSFISFVQFFIKTDLTLLDLTYDLFLYLIQYFRPSDSHGFSCYVSFLSWPLENIHCTVQWADCEIKKKKKLLGVSSPVNFTSVYWLTAWQNASLFWKEYNHLHLWVSTSDTCIRLETWKIEKLSDTSVVNNTCREWPYFPGDLWRYYQLI